MHLNIFINRSSHTKGNGFWKFNSSLIKDHIYVAEIKYLVSSFYSNVANMNAQLNWELLKYEFANLPLIIQNAKQKKKKTTSVFRV